MDYKWLFTTMNQKGYHYFSGNTNSKGEISFDFSALHNGKGDSIMFILNESGLYEATVYDTWEDTQTTEKNITEQRICEIIKNL